MIRLNSIGLLLATALLGTLPRAGATQDIFLCVDDQGRKTYQNTGNSKGCKKLDVQPILTLPAPRAAAKPAQNSADARPTNFPRVDSETQRARDSDRKRVLEDELKSEEDKLSRLRAEYNNGEPERRGDERNYARYQDRVQRLQAEIQRSESNVTSLKREISLLQRQ
ncbi:MAG: DUF4124 domain-containing protein [Gemmatimonadota bacterium]